MNELSKTTAAKIRTTLENVEKRLTKMEKLKDEGAKTNGIFHWDGRPGAPEMNSNSVNITKVMDIAYLISIFGYLLNRAKEYEESARVLGISTFPLFKWSGYPLEAWKSDILARVNMILYDGEIKRLTNIKRELSVYISKEDKVNKMLESLAELTEEQFEENAD